MTPPSDLCRTFDLFIKSYVGEVRVPKAGKLGTLSGYFDTLEPFVAAVKKLDGQENVYFTLNPVLPALLARYANRIQSYAKTTTSDADIILRRWLLVDLDVERPADISSSDEEWAAALSLATEIHEWLRDQHGIDAVLADSGNGGHVLIPMDLPNDDASKELCIGLLKALDFRFTGNGIKIDQTTFNASRICKLYSTLAVKGDSIPDRPHRRSRLLYVPDEIRPAPIKVLKRIAGLAPEPPKATKSASIDFRLLS